MQGRAPHRRVGREGEGRDSEGAVAGIESLFKPTVMFAPLSVCMCMSMYSAIFASS
jgi:hypothetical protein